MCVMFGYVAARAFVLRSIHNMCYTILYLVHQAGTKPEMEEMMTSDIYCFC